LLTAAASGTMRGIASPLIQARAQAQANHR